MVESMRPGRLLQLAVAATLVGMCWGSCQSPLTAEEGFSCTNADAGVFSSLPPTNWWQLTNPPARSVPGIDYITNYYQCCRHCVWNLGYPAAAPIVAMLDTDLNCVDFRDDFAVFDVDGDNKMNSTELGLYLASGPNKFLMDNQMMDPAYIFSSVDLDRNGAISLEEYLVLRHYWATVHLVRSGNLRPSIDGTPAKDGPLGGFFLDYGQIKAFFTVVNSYLLNKYWDSGFDASLVREPTEQEVASVVQNMDLDGSTRVSLEEHYFRVFADRNGDGYVSNQEYYVSLYNKLNAAGLPDNPFLYPINFKFHDWNEDGKVTFLERKFVSADLNQDARINAREWLLADFPSDFGPFEKHAVVEVPGQPGNLNSVRYFFYTMFHECASQGSREYQRPIVDYPWSRSCILEVLIDNAPPFITFEEDTVSVCGGGDCNGTASVERLAHRCDTDQQCRPGRACSDFGYCQHMDQFRPTGPLPRKRRWITAPTGYDIKVFEEMAARLNYNYTLTPHRGVTVAQAPAPIPGEMNINSLPPTTFVLSSTHRQRHHGKEWETIPAAAYKCTEALWTNDGLVVVVNAQQEIVSSEEAMLRMLVSASFINFVAIFFLFTLGIGHVFWFLERGTNPLFRPFYAEGVMDGVWFSFVTVTTVGYGDKYPITNIGKLIGAFWMLFGLICFGLFGGQVTNHIADMQYASQVIGIESLQGLSGVGLLNTTDQAALSSQFGFGFQSCTTMKQCADRVLNRENHAMLVPHSEVIQYFKSSGLDSLACGNTLLIVGDPVLRGDSKSGSQNSLCLCDTCNQPVKGTAIYAASYFKDAFDEQLSVMKAEGTLEAIAEEFLTAPSATKDCPAETEFNLELIAVALSTVAVAGIINFIIWSPWTKPWCDAQFAIFAKHWEQMMYSLGFKHRKFDLLSADETEVIEDDDKVLSNEQARHVQIAKYLSKLQNLCVGHNTDVRNLQKEVMEARETMAKVIKFFMTAGALVLCMVSLSVTALVIIWGCEIKPTQLGIAPGAEILHEL
mmetsp:Transcript_54045/g.128437  ORF Transcript_54045/g.128437 Transcript_54045/m.128437 type:complete len:1016 (-) Transcript_54045:194-3241(-)|eukprot:CAMPEP_0180131072 /NCGR_PEP_ID=MMETSP0986-20121125/8215_1 /TAXON_ID=697907 /ORGANISM="non described non described, Strain CCMP2293" /LENGTH=1015 /DNA_ID=CAMNT_0022070905 /DNA_START=265 /DNA_END=3312 /DNA_ORIENTATION=+